MKMKSVAWVVACLAVAAQAKASEAQLMSDVDAEAAHAEGGSEAPESEQQQLSNDMKEAHEEVVDKEAGYKPVPTVTTTHDESKARGVTNREGFTFELGAGIHYTSEYLDSDRRIAGMLGGSLGWFLNERTALLLRIVGSSTSDSDGLVVFAEGRDRAATRYRGLTTYFIGPQIQFFPIDRIMLAAGVGLSGVASTARLDIDGADDVRTSDGDLGVGASLRAGFTVYQRQDIAALRIGLEALPMYVADAWRISTGLVGELQIF